jgi:plastocyanin
VIARVALLSSLTLLAACSSPPEGDVVMKGHRFEPATITVQSGDTVVWVNQEGDSHTVTAYEDEIPEGADFFASGDAPDQEAASDDVGAGLLQNGDSYEVTFDTPGRYEYFCIPHEREGMKGTVIVEG